MCHCELHLQIQPGALRGLKKTSSSPTRPNSIALLLILETGSLEKYQCWYWDNTKQCYSRHALKFTRLSHNEAAPVLKTQVTWLQEPYGLNVPQCKTGYNCVFSKNHFPYLHRILRGRQSWNMQVMIERLKTKHFSTVKAQGSDDRNTHSFHPARRKKGTISPASIMPLGLASPTQGTHCHFAPTPQFSWLPSAFGAPTPLLLGGSHPLQED